MLQAIEEKLEHCSAARLVVTVRKVKVQEFALSHFNCNFAPNGDVVATDNALNEAQAHFGLQFNNILALLYNLIVSDIFIFSKAVRTLRTGRTTAML